MPLFSTDNCNKKNNALLPCGYVFVPSPLLVRRVFWRKRRKSADKKYFAPLYKLQMGCSGKTNNVGVVKTRKMLELSLDVRNTLLIWEAKPFFIWSGLYFSAK